MFPFITHTCNPLGGGPCVFGCSYCWATALKNRYKYKKYQGEFKLYEKELRDYTDNDFVFPFDMIDIADPNIDAELTLTCLEWIEKQPCKMLLLTKSPKFYYDWRNHIPKNVVCGVTIESDTSIMSDYSKAPAGYHRLWWMEEVRKHLPNDRFVSIEPIMEFSPDFDIELRKIDPWAVAVGYDNYNNGLPEPSKAVTEALIYELEQFTTVYRKTIREANQ